MKYNFLDFHLRSPEFFRRFLQKRSGEDLGALSEVPSSHGNSWGEICGKTYGETWGTSDLPKNVKVCQGRFFLFWFRTILSGEYEVVLTGGFK